jgi:hypothetical protein
MKHRLHSLALTCALVITALVGGTAVISLVAFGSASGPRLASEANGPQQEEG